MQCNKNELKPSQKIALIKKLSDNRILPTQLFYDILTDCGDLKFNYFDYASTHPIDCRKELSRLPYADYDTCCALLTMLLREDHFSNGSFEKRQRNGEVKPIIDKMLLLLQNERQPKGESMKKILLNDLLHFPKELLENAKIRFNQYDSLANPMELYLKDPEIVNTQWLFWRTKQRYFKVGQIAVCLLKLSPDTWLLTTIKRITKELDVLNGINYEGQELDEYQQYYGRVIIKYHKTAQTQGINYPTISSELEVLQLLPTTFDGDEFPGYDNVKLSYSQLLTILQRKKQSWISALENQKAVYLITDTSNGKLYVGSATGDNGMLLQRWQQYAQNGHGGNKELITLINSKGFDYVKKHFQYSILENYNSKIDDHVILKRESWWKDVLQSRRFGYNGN